MATLSEEFQKNWLIWCLGVAIFIGSAYLITWNEGRAVYHSHSLEETHNNAISLNSYDRQRPEYDDRVVHISGELKIEEPLTEPEYGISIQAVKLKRRVQMYQWVEERSPRAENDDIVGNQKSVNDYYYFTEWRDKLVDSSNFYIRHGHQNPSEIPLKTVTHISPHVRMGPLTLTTKLKDKFNDWIEVTSDERPERSDVKLHMGIYYHCQDIWNPEVGDIRVQFYYAGENSEHYTIIAKQKNGRLEPFVTSRGHEISLLRPGQLSIHQMFTVEHSEARAETWKLRFYGCALMYFAILCLCKVLQIFFTTLLRMDNVISGDPLDMTNFLVAGSFSLAIIAFAWIAYRPMIGAALIFTALSPFMYCVMSLYNGFTNDTGLRYQ